MKKFLILPVAVLLTMLASAASATSATSATSAKSDMRLLNGNSVYGVPATVEGATRVVDLSQAPKKLNIKCGDVVTFVKDGQSFSWRFDVVGHTPVDLAVIAPRGFLTQPLTVYVGTNDGERS